jgi:hypothetical protein
MQLALEKKWTDRLLELPESGMGYQRVRVRLKDGRTLKEVLVFNAEILSVPDTVRQFTPSDIVSIEPERLESK